MKCWSSTEHVFQHPWDVVTAAAWRKYPNDLNPNVREIDVVERKVTDEGILETTRVFGTTFPFPALLGQLLGLPEICHAVEHVTVDPVRKEMTLRMLNHTFCGMLAVNEKLIYKQSPTDENITILEQSADISVTNISFHNYFEDTIVSGFDSNCVKGRAAIEDVCRMINVEFEELTQKFNLEKDELSRKFDVEIDELAKKFDTEVQIISTSLEEAKTSIEEVIRDAESSIEEAISNIPSPITSASCEGKDCADVFFSGLKHDPTATSPLGIMDKVLERGLTAKPIIMNES